LFQPPIMSLTSTSALCVVVTIVMIGASATSTANSNHDAKSIEYSSIQQAKQLLDKIGYEGKSQASYDKMMPYAIKYVEAHSTRPAMTYRERYSRNGGDITFTCEECSLGVGVILTALELGESINTIADTLIAACITLKIEDEDVCTEIINLEKDTVGYVAAHTTLDSSEICGVVVGMYCMTESIADKLRWTVELTSTPKPPVVPVEVPTTDSPALRFLQITDIHYDEEYYIGSLAECSEPCCCESGSGSTSSVDEEAGTWGDYRSCDIPQWTLENTLAHINQTQLGEIDYIIWTGDIPAHDVWKQTKDSVLSAIDELYNLFRVYFPNTPIYPALGNHEANPIDCYSQPEMNDTDFSMDWLLGPVAEQWMSFLPNDTYNTIRLGGYYTTLIRPGFRMISLNTNYGHSSNWWNLLNIPDPAGMLAWFVEQLDAAEQNGEKVHVLVHIPCIPSQMISPWVENYQKIITRYESTIMAQFHGHVHCDEFTVYRDANDTTRAVGVGYASPSLTTYSDYNPAYRIYTVDGDRENSTRAILDHSTYYFDMSQANEGSLNPQWMLAYSAKEAYGLNSLNPSDWYELALNMETNDTLFQTYYSFYHRFSPAFAACDDDCKSSLLNFVLAPLPL